MRQARYLSMAALLLLGACGGDGPAPTPLSAAPPPLDSYFIPGKPGLIQVTLRDAQPVAVAELVDPDGNAYPVSVITHDREVQAAQGDSLPQLEMNTMGSPSNTTTSVGAGIPLYNDPTPPADRVVVSRFTVQVPDMDAYRATWQRWKFHVTLGATKSNEREIEFLPPKPPSDS